MTNAPSRRGLTTLSLAALAASLAAPPRPARAQPRPMPAAPDAPAVERWFQRACGVGRAADTAWATSHVRAPVTVDRCEGESRRRCRHNTLRDAAEAVRLACEGDVVERLRREAPALTFAAWSAEMDGRRFVARGATRRVEGLIGQFARVLVMTAGADGEATLTAIDER